MSERLRRRRSPKTETEKGAPRKLLRTPPPCTWRTRRCRRRGPRTPRRHAAVAARISNLAIANPAKGDGEVTFREAGHSIGTNSRAYKIRKSVTEMIKALFKSFDAEKTVNKSTRRGKATRPTSTAR